MEATVIVAVCAWKARLKEFSRIYGALPLASFVFFYTKR
jgi:hypothetical protein